MSKTLRSLLRSGSIEDIGLELRWDPTVLVEEVTRRATALSQMGIGRGSRVAIVHSGSARFFADLFAVWTVGATAACLDSTLTSTELEIVSRFTEPTAVLVDRSAPSAELSAPIVELATCRPSRVETTFADPDPNDAALVLFTSGTTGSPKGVVLSFRALRKRVKLNIAAIGAEVLKRALVTLPTHFGHGLIGNALTPLMAGGDIVLFPRGFSLAEDLGQIIDKHEISFMSSVPTLWHIVKRSSRPPSGNSLLRVHVGSAPLSARSWSEIADWSRAEVVNCYGMTETANWIAGASSRSDGIADGLLGKPWGGVASVIDDGGSIQSAGTGELIVKSPSLMSGYLKREDLTAAAMIDGWFRTGDSGTVDELGRIWLTGRIKDEINRAGFKVQPAEIDILLETHPAIAETCVFAVPDPISGEIVGAAIRLASGANLDIGSLRTWCRERLRREAVPDRWFIVDQIPRNARGKVNRDAVRTTLLGASDVAQRVSEKPDHDRSDRSRPVTRTRHTEISADDDLMLRVRNVVECAWTASLDQQSYRANLPWDDAGGDSIGALQLWLAIEGELSRQLPLETLTPGFTPSELVSAIALILSSDDATAVLDEASERLPVVFFLPHADGDVPALAQFRAAINDHIRFVVIEYPRLSEMVDDRGRFDQLVDAAERQVLAQCGDQPCRLVGYSFGGFVAWETARRLTQTGRGIGFLGLIDSQLVVPQDRSFLAAAQDRSFLAAVSERVFSAAWWQPGRLYLGCLENLIELLARLLPLSVLRRVDRWGNLLPSRTAFRFRYELVSKVRVTSLRNNRLEPLQVPTTLFRSDEYAARLPDHGWSRLCNELVIVPVRGGHNFRGDVPIDREELSAKLVQAIETQ
jgi:acyl-CoA synthetase (AMP-forming)/AMP-acid ligase II/thioesterase domain-containing protein